MGKYKSAAELAEKYGYDEDLTRQEWKALKKEHGGAAAALAWLGVQDEFNKEYEFLEERTQVWEDVVEKADAMLEGLEPYQISDAITDLVNTLTEKSSEIEDVYTSGSMAIEDIVDTYIPEALNIMTTGVAEHIGTAEKAADELGSLYQEGSEEMRGYYSEGISRMYGAGEEALGVVREKGATIEDIYAGAAKGIVSAYGAGTQEMMGAARAGLTESLYGAGAYEDTYRRLAERTTLPGEEIYRQQIGGETARGIEQVKEYGAGQAGALSAITAQQRGTQQDLQNLAIQRANWLTQNQQNYAEAQKTAAQMKAGAYGEYGQKAFTAGGAMAGAYGTAAGMLGGGYERLLAMETGALQNLSTIYGTGAQIGSSAAQAATQLAGYGMETGYDKILAAQQWGTESLYGAQMEAYEQELSAEQIKTALEAMGITEGAALATQAAETEQEESERAYYYNQLMPWQTGISYYTGATQQYDPYAGYMSYYGDITGAKYSTYQGAQQSTADFWSGLSETIGSGISAFGQASPYIFGSGTKKTKETS